MKKSQLIVVIFALLIIFCFLLLNNTHEHTSNGSADLEITNIHHLSSPDAVIDNYKDDVDLSYNYITNPQLLSEFDFLGVGITAFGDTVSDYVKSMGFTSQKLEIIDASQDSSIITVTIAIEESDTILIVAYDNLTNEFSFQTK